MLRLRPASTLFPYTTLFRSLADARDDLRVAERIEPDVGVVVRVLIEPRGVEQAEHVLAVPGGLLQLGLKPVSEQEDDVGSVNLGDVFGRDLEIMRLGTRRRQITNVNLRAADLLRSERKGIEASDD